MFLSSLRTVQRVTASLPIPRWARPGLGGLALGVFCVPIILFVGWRVAQPGQGLGLLGGGYGAVQLAISGSAGCRSGGRASALLAGLCLAKIIASSLTIGSGGSAGDFAPSLVIGGLFGGAFGRAAQMLLNDPHIEPGAFALVAMGTFYGGIAHVPLSSLVLVCELAGSYDLLVPLMLAEGIAFVAAAPQLALPGAAGHAARLTRPPAQDARHPAHDPRGLGDAHGLGQRRADRGRPSSASAPTPTCAPPPRLLLNNKLHEIQVTDAGRKRRRPARRDRHLALLPEGRRRARQPAQDHRLTP